MSNIILKIITIVFLTYVGIVLFFYIKQRDFIYFPVKTINHPYQEQIFFNGNIAINVTVLNKGKKKALMYFGGNAENVDYNALEFSSLFPNYTIYLVKYRGYGGSAGKPEEQAIYSDVLTIYDTIQLGYTSVSVIGRSLGSGVATYLASKRKIKKMVLITPFDSIQNVAQKMFPIFPMSLLLKDKYDSFSRIHLITAKTLIISAENDRVIHKKHTNRLVSGFPSSQLSVKVIQDKGHNSISDSKQYYTVLADFL